MLETVAFFDPIDYHSLKRLVRERLDGEYDTDTHREALENLKKLNMVERGGLAHEYVYITNEGWQHLGGETSRHGVDVDSVDDPECAVCQADDLATENW